MSTNLSVVEKIKNKSDGLRGTLMQSLEDHLTGAIREDDQSLIKHHGMYQQDDRDQREERSIKKLEWLYSFMIRLRLPGGFLTPTQWINMHHIAGEHSTGVIKITTRQTVQLHGILKSHLKPTLKAFATQRLDSIAACGDVNRNVICAAHPKQSKIHEEVFNYADKISTMALPKTNAYYEIWLDREPLINKEEEKDPLYQDRYLPRKFKIAIAIPPNNDVDVFTNDIGLIAVGKADVDLANYVIQNVAEVRKDCVAFISPQNLDTDEFVIGATTDQTDQIRNYADLIVSSSYAFIDSGAKYQYDQYKDTYRWVPLNGDTAGLTARADFTNDPWFSPAGYNRGIIKNAIKLAYNPTTRTELDILYQARVNPVVAERGQGILLLGDKTALSKPSAFDRINVRRLFITLEKAISTAAKYMLFEFNDTTTRNLFVGMLLPYLRDIAGRRGIQSFSVVCDASNNTEQVIATNEFVADIYIQPNYSINYITLNFIATKSGAVQFNITGA